MPNNKKSKGRKSKKPGCPLLRRHDSPACDSWHGLAKAAFDQKTYVIFDQELARIFAIA